MLLPIPFTDLSSRKVRPAVVIGHSAHPGDLFVAPISSQLQNITVPLRDWRMAGLNVPCGIKSQLATVEDRLVVKSVGKLSVRDQTDLDQALRDWLKL
ncbi:MAG: type II toxin-antitoxin system PemK/MazF family toxin [Opitutaceae bacterium]|nr:type II toxin-antitoxin system PemK/MazF family toxin [Opitutaceae bacterium]